MKYVYLLLSFLFILTGCSKDDKKDKIITVTIASEKRMGYVGWYGAMSSCYLVKYPESNTWSFFRSHIEGFDYEPGYEYVVEIRVHEDPVDPNMADQELLSYFLEKIISKEKKDSENLPDNEVPNTPEDEN